MCPRDPVRRHELEKRLNADAEDIMNAILGGFRAIIDVKGKLAEYFLSKRLEALAQEGIIDGYEWNDRDGFPDFTVRVGSATLLLEAKNVRSPQPRRSGARVGEMTARVELQKTRNAKDGTNTRGYRVGEFNCLAACLFNQTGRWEYLFVTADQLERRETAPDFLKIMQVVPTEPSGIWSGDLANVLKTAADCKLRQE